MSVPEWVSKAIFYQIFPDRFANGDPGNDPVNTQPWGTPPTRRGFQGGDLKGIAARLDYLLDLGVNAIYLNPIFMAASTHRYDTIDYLRIDPKLGELQDFHTLIETAHRSGVRVILDGVFNHCARGFFAFNDILENEGDSPYLDWFFIRRLPLRAYERGRARNYRAWWGIKSLPKLNTGNPHARRYLLDVARYWIEQGADGWRLDVPNEIDDDSFWTEFRDVVHSANPDAYLLGEIWELVPRWVDDRHFDGLMNYPVRTAVLDFLNGRQSAAEFGLALERVLSAYPAENLPAMYNLLGSHDTERAISLLGGETGKLRLAFLFLFAFPGAPAIYYGDEVGLEGWRDPDCRRAFPWDQSLWKPGLREWVQALVAARKASPALQRGAFCRLPAGDNPHGFAFARALDGETVVTVLNASGSTAWFAIPVNELGLADGSLLRSMLDVRVAVVEEGYLRLALAPQQGIYLRSV
jgi:glycosidase